jgi:hypothetical protein
VDNLYCIFVQSILILHQEIRQTMIPQRTQLQLNNQARNLFISIYERAYGVNLHGILPQRDVANQEYRKTKAECIAIATRYEDEALRKEFELNF